MKVFLLLLSFCTAVFCFSCKSDENQNEDLTNTVNKNGAVETAVTVQHLNDSFDILTTTHTVWHLGNEYKKIAYADTILSLGKETAQVENAEGETVPVVKKKEYEIFITVK